MSVFDLTGDNDVSLKVFDRHGAMVLISAWDTLSRWKCEKCGTVAQVVDYGDKIKIKAKGRCRKVWVEGHEK